MKHKPLMMGWVVGLLAAAVSVGAQPRYTTANLHAHNDYEQAFPFWQAYNAGFGSMEADVFLRNGQLLVAHTAAEIDSSRTLASLYLAPLRQLVERHQGYLAADTSYHLQLLIDLKTEAAATLDALVALLGSYPKLTACKALSLVITGNRPPMEQYGLYPAYLLFDGRFGAMPPPEAGKRIPLISENLARFANWNGKGIPTQRDQAQLDSAVAWAHALGKKVRFWNAPDTINAWYELMKTGVDYINTDHIDQAATFVRQLPQRSVAHLLPYPLYTPRYRNDGLAKPVKNVILIIGDGMGLSQLYAGYTANRAALQTFLMRHTGLSKTSSADSYVTDSAPGSTAFSAGEKTNNRAVGISPSGRAFSLLPAILKANNVLTGVVTCGDITDATPADFYAHQPERSDSRRMLDDLQHSPIQLLMGAGNPSIDQYLTQTNRVFALAHHTDSLRSAHRTRWIITEPQAGLSMAKGRGPWLPNAFERAAAELSRHNGGFFLVVEGAQVDYGGHANDLPYLVAEVHDLDRVVAKAMQFADANGETLVVATADHETGGLTLLNGHYSSGYVSGQFATNDHTATPVPVFAYGPMAQLFGGVYENTAIFQKILTAFGKEKREK
jgi:alkaline phosphatase